MSTSIKVFLCFIFFPLFTLQAQARSSAESVLLLREAMMESNADYNKHKKKMNHEEMDRADNWGERSEKTILIDGKAAMGTDLARFQDELKDDNKGYGRDVSSNIPSDED